MTTRLRTEIQMPPCSHGKQFIAKASFLKHIDDAPRFGPESTFLMPLTTADFDHQHHEDFETHIREVERHRQEIERLEAAFTVARQSTDAK
jgi:hypothetical protein